MRGEYRFIENGKIVARVENLITTAGKRVIMQYLAGMRSGLASHIAVGSVNNAAALTDTELAFEFARGEVTSVSPDYTNTLLVYKARLDQNAAGQIYEAGLWSTTDFGSEYVSRLLLDFDSNTDIWSAGSFVTGSRVGVDMLRLAPATSTTVTANRNDTYYDLSGYSNSDEFRMTYNVGNANTASVALRFYTDASNYYTYTINTPTAGYKYATFNKTNFVATGTPSWANITYASVSATANASGAAQVDFDGVRIEDKDTFTDNNILISRAVPGSPITKTVGLPMDIEYSIDITL